MGGNRNILAIIPARGGSKGLPKKNLYPVNGKPLIVYTIEAALKSKSITKTIVSSDDAKTLELSKNHGAEIVKRQAKYASDEASSESVILDTLKQLRNAGESFDIIVLLQPTSPLRSSADIDNAIQTMYDQNANAVISVINIGIKPFKSYYLNEKGFLQGVYNNETPNLRRQDLPDAYLPTGAIYAVFTKIFLRTKSLLPLNTVPYIMEKYKSIDIDIIDDITRVENVLTKY